MSCVDDIVRESGMAAFLRELKASKHSQSCFPISASLDFTNRCSLSCQHCFVKFPGSDAGEMNTHEVKKVLDELAACGVLFLLITGGEALARTDFQELYLHAKSAGFVVTLFTNATLIDEDTAAFLAAHPPRRVEATVYGHTKQTYETVTQTPGSFARFRAGVDALLRHGILLRLKAMVMTTNVHEFEQMKAWSESLGCDFRYDGVIHARLNGDLSPNQYRQSPEAIARLHFLSPSDKTEFHDYMKEAGTQTPPKRTLLECGAGVMSLHVDASGNAHPCMLWRSDPYSLLTGSLDERWAALIRTIRSRPAPDGECSVCPDRALCSYCAPVALLETGQATQPSRFYCELTAERKQQCLAPVDSGAETP